jgi:hypothetical protein
MAKKLSATQVKEWQERIKLGEAFRQPHEDKWMRFIGYMQNKFIDVMPANQADYIGVNLVHPMVKVIIPSIYSKNPDVVVVPRQEKYQQAAYDMQKFIRYIFREIDLKTEVKLTILDALLCGHSWIKTGFATQFEAIEEEKEKKQTLIDYALSIMGVASSEEEEDNYSEENKQRYAAAPNEKIVQERPWALRTSPFRMVVPAYSQRPEELPWIAEQIVMPMIDLENHPDWDLPKDLSPSTDVYKLLQKRGTSISQSGTISDKDLQYKVMYEVWDLREGCIYMISDNDEHCYDFKTNEYRFLDSRHPYVMLKFNDVPDEFYPLSDVEPWEPQLLELNQTRSQMVNHRKRYNRRYVYSEGVFTTEELAKLEKGDDGSVIATSADDARTAVMPVQDAALPPEAYAVEQRVKADITEISGITTYQRGNTSQGAKTATEAAIVEGQSRNRNDERLDVVTTFVGRITKNIASISQKFMTQDLVFPIIGEGAISWVQLNDDRTLAGDFMFEVTYGSSVPINPDVDRQQFNEFYQLTANDPYFDPIKIRLEMVRKYRLTDPESYLNNQLAAMLKQKRMQDAMMANPDGSVPEPTEPGEGGPPIGEGGVPDSTSIKQGIDQSVAVPTPGGIGGGALVKL